MLPQLTKSIRTPHSWLPIERTLISALKSLSSPSRWKLEGQIIWRRKGLFCLVVGMQFFHGQMTNIAFYRHVPGERLKDLGYELIPLLSSDYHVVSEIIFWSIFTIIITLSFTPFLHKKPPIHTVCTFISVSHSYSCYQLQATTFLRTLLVMAMCLILRCLSFLSTSLPGPAVHCQPMSDGYNPPDNLYDISNPLLTVTNGCGDLVFSSHISMTLCLIGSAYVYGPLLVPKKFFRSVFYLILLPGVILEAILIIAARKHYTVDVIVAIYTTPMVYYASYYFVSDEELAGINQNGSKRIMSSTPPYVAENQKLNVE